MSDPKISICVPFHWMSNWVVYLNRCLKSIEEQTFKDYEVVLIKHSTMPVTSNKVIAAASGELIKIIYMDDALLGNTALQQIWDVFQDKEVKWLVNGCLHNYGVDKTLANLHVPSYDDEQLRKGINTIGSPSVLTMRNEGALFFDEKLNWELDIDLYIRLYEKYGLPKIIDNPLTEIGIHPGQMTVLLSESEKLKERNYVENKYKSTNKV